MVKSSAMSPIFGISLVVVALIYLVVIIYQVYKARLDRSRLFEYSNSSEYSDLSASDSERGRDYTSNSVPNTCSYNES